MSITKRVVPMAAIALAVLLAALVPAAAAAGTIVYYHNDLAGSPIAATNESGQVIWRESYRPYGERLTNDPGSATNKIWFTSRSQNAATGLVYMGARWYDPVVGRFVSTDPKRFDEKSLHSFNRYAYANNNPVKFVDPDGESPVSVLMAWMVRSTSAGYGAGVMADAASQYAAWRSIDWGLALSSSAAKAGAEAGLMSPAPGMSVGLTIEKFGERGVSVLGHYPGYVNAAENAGARFFNVPASEWAKMSPAEQWSANARFLDRLIARVDTVLLSTPATEARAGSWFARELEYLSSRGYALSKDGTRMLPPSPQ